MATEPKNPKYATWSKARRFELAVKRVVLDGWTQVEACAEFGVSRASLNPKVQAFRLEHAERIARIKTEEAQRAPTVGNGPLGLDERRRVPESFQEFDDYYFGHWQCPDCEIHHDRQPFHNEITDVLNDPSVHRSVINLPPFHAKTTVATVKNTILRVVENPNTRQLLISKSQTFAKTFLQSISELLTDHDLYQPGRDLIDDYGPFRAEGAASIWNQNQIYVAGRHTPEKDPTIQVLGVGNQIYGRRADDATLDDIADVENSRNPDNVLKTLEWLDKMVHNRVGKRGKVVYVGTRVNHGDVYSHLRQRPGWKVVTYPCILDDETESVLWPEHFPYSQALLFRNDMTAADFQLVYQNVDIPGLHADFPPEIVEACKDTSRVIGHYENGWRLVAGLDPAGGNKGSGYTAFTLRGIDLRTGKRFLIDQVAVKSMRAPQLRDQMFEWTDRYPIYEWRVESNGLQSQLVQYNEEIIQYLQRKGVRVVPHHTHTNKWDPDFGVASMATQYRQEMVSIPWGNAQSAQVFQPYIDQLIAFPMGAVTDRVMSDWFSDLGCRDFLNRSHLPMFNDRMRVPKRVRRRRHVVDFYGSSVKRIPLAEQRAGARFGTRPGGGRQTVGRPAAWSGLEDLPADEPKRFANIPGFVGQ